MNEIVFPYWIGFMFLLGGALGGVLVGVVVATRIARQWVVDHMPKAPEFFVIDELNLYSIVEDGEQTRQRMSMTTTAQEFNARMAEIWLEQRGLMAMPKGQDFKVKAPAGGRDARG